MALSHCERIGIDFDLIDIVSLADQILWAGQAEKGELTLTTKIPNRFFQRLKSIPSVRFTPNAISSYWGTIGRLEGLILMLKNLIK